MGGCVDRLLLDPALLDSGSDTETGTETDGFSTETDGPTSSGDTGSSDPTNPTNPTSPTNPTLTTTGPTTSPTDPTLPTSATNPTNPTGIPIAGPPQLIDVQVLDGNVLELYFNEAMTDPSAIDPNNFRLSLSYSNYYGNGYEYGGTFYADLSRFTGEEICNEYCYCEYYDEYCEEEYCNEYCYTQPGPPIMPIGLSPTPGLGDRFQLILDTPITTQICDRVREYQQNWSSAGIFLHYSNNAAPLVSDSQGELLAPIAEHWVLPPQREYSYVPGYFDAMVPFIPINCPF